MTQQTQTSIRDKDRQGLERVDRELSATVPMKVGEAGALQIVPSNMDQAMEFAVMMSKAGDMIRPQFRGNPGACMAISMFAWRVGLDPFVVSNKAYITVNTKGGGHVTQVAYEAQLIHAIINLRAPLAKRLRAVYSGEGQTRRVEIIGYIQGDDEPLKYESPEFKDIKVTNSPLWQADRDQQFWYYGTRAWARRHFPEIIMGAYTREEIEDGLAEPAPVDITPGDRAARPTAAMRAQQDEAIDAEAEELQPAAFDLVSVPDGEVREYEEPAAFSEAFGQAIDEFVRAGDGRGLDAFWETNSGALGRLRDLGGDAVKQADWVAGKYRAGESLIKTRAAEQRQAAQSGEAGDAAAEAGTAATETGKTTKPATDATKTAAKTTKPAETSTSAAAAVTGKPEPWIFKPIGGREKPQQLGSAREFAEAMLKTIKEQGYAPSAVSTFAYVLNKPSLERLDHVDPDLYQAVIAACVEAGCNP